MTQTNPNYFESADQTLDDLSRATTTATTSRTSSSARPARPSIPNYPGITAGALLIRFFATFLFLIGVLGLILGIGTIVDRADDWSRGAEPVEVLMFIGPTLAGGVLLIAVSIFFFMNASLAIAVRDIARNSFLAQR